MSTVKFSNAGLFRQAVEGSLLAAGTDDSIPALSAVKVDWSDGKVRFTSTDRYRLLFIDMLAETEGEGSVLIPRRQIAAAVKAIPKTDKKGTPPSFVTMIDVENRIVSLGWKANGTSASAEFDNIASVYNFPDVDSLVSRFTTGPLESTIMNGDFLADIGKLPNNRLSRVEFCMPAEAGKPSLARGGVNDSGSTVLAWEYWLMPVAGASVPTFDKE